MEATNWYFHKRIASQVDLDDLKAFVLLTAVKNSHGDVVARLVQRTAFKRDMLSENPERGAPFLALTLASRHLKGDLNQRILTRLKGLLGLKDKLYEDNDLRRRGLSLLTWAIQCGHHPLVQALAKQVSVQHNEDFCAEALNMITPLALASHCGHEAIARTLIMNGADLHKSESDRWTALSYASCQSHRDTVKMLLRHGAETETQDWKRKTSLHVAAQYGKAKVLKLLIDSDANIETENLDKCTPLHIAAKLGQKNVVKVLIKNGANIESEDESQRTPLHIAARYGQANVVKVLIDNGASIETNDYTQYTPLHITAIYRQENAMRLLIDNGANIEARDNKGRTPIMHAAWEGHETPVLHLFEKGANLLATDEKGSDIRHWILNASNLGKCRASDHLVALVYDKACQSMHASHICPPLISTRRAVISLEVIGRLKLSLCSLHAYLDLPLGTSASLIDFTRRILVIDATVGVKTVDQTLRFSVIHQEDSLEFAVAIMHLYPAASIRLQVVNGGTRSVRTHRESLFQKWLGVELDPNAEIVDAVVPWHAETSTPTPTIEDTL